MQLSEYERALLDIHLASAPAQVKNLLLKILEVAMNVERQEQVLNDTLKGYIQKSELSVRVYNCLNNCPYIDMPMKEFLKTVTASNLLKMPNFGIKSLREFNETLDNYGLKISGMGSWWIQDRLNEIK